MRILSILLTTLLGAACDQTGPEREIVGQALYEQHCARCHGMDGKPVPGQTEVRDLSDSRIVDRLSDEHIKMVVRRGKPPAMPAFEDEFTEASLMVLLAYVRGLSGSAGKHGRPGMAPEGGVVPEGGASGEAKASAEAKASGEAQPQ